MLPDAHRALPMDDLDRLMAIMDTAFDPHWGEAWNRRQVGDALTTPATHYLLIDADSAPPSPGKDAIGFLLSRSSVEEEELLLIGILPVHRGRGLGRKLVDRYLAAARNRGARHIVLEMRENNEARVLYEAAGFREVGRRPDYYRTANGERIDAITFRRDLY